MKENKKMNLNVCAPYECKHAIKNIVYYVVFAFPKFSNTKSIINKN